LNPDLVEIRELTGEQCVEAIYALGSYAFHASPPFRDRETTLEIIRNRRGVRYYAALDLGAGEPGQPVAGAAASAMTQNLCGRIFPSAGIWGVATLPHARRLGFCRGVMQVLLASLHADGYSLANLYPFRESFYARMGFVNLHQAQIARFSPQSLAPLLKCDLPGQVELALISDAYPDFRSYIFDLQPYLHGMTLFDHGEPERAAQNRFWVAKAVVGGQVRGMMLYDLQGEELTHFLLRARLFSYRDSQARYLLLAWIARHIDQADRVELVLPAWERPETWLEDLQVSPGAFFLPPMGRVLDVSRLDGLPVGNVPAAAGLAGSSDLSAESGSFSAQITDPLCPWNEGRWRFYAQDGRLQVNPAQQADCVLSIRGLTALVYGVNDPGDFALRGWGDPSPELQQVMRGMFPPQVVHLHETF